MTTRYNTDQRVSEYVLEECIGFGSFAEVWRARHHVWKDARVAIKLPTEPEYVRYLQREGIVVHGLRHPNIVRVLGFDPYADIPYLVMELVRGPSLRQLLDDHARGLPIATVETLLRGMLAGIQAAHTAGVLHRDLKPGNVLLDLDGRPPAALRTEDVKLADFGFGVNDANTLRSIAQSGSLDRDHRIVGTLAYMAPETQSGTRAADPRSDLFAVGVMLFEMLTGERPAGAELPSTVRAEVPPALDQLFRGLCAGYERRFAGVEQVLEALDRRVRTEPVLADAPRAESIHSGLVHGRCRSCRHPVQPDDQFCTNCGEQIATDVRRCPACRSFPGPRDRFCIYCGSTLLVKEV
ncbi:MAG: serine/threonine-protein kinase [Phycisphaerae bacterium]